MLKSYREIVTDLILERLALFKGDALKAAKSLNLSSKSFNIEYARILMHKNLEENKIEKEKKENESILQKIKEDEESDYKEPTHFERDDWYNRDRF